MILEDIKRILEIIKKVDLHNHTDFSNSKFPDSICKTEALIDYAYKIGSLGLAITDHDCVSSFIRAGKYLKKKRNIAENRYNDLIELKDVFLKKEEEEILARIKKDFPDLMNLEEFNYNYKSWFVHHIEEAQKEMINWKKFRLIYGNEIYLCRNGLNKDNLIKGKDKFYHFILLAKDEEGNRQIRELSSRAWARSFQWVHRRVPTYYSDLDEIVATNPGHLIASSACLGSWLDNRILEAKEFEDKDEERYQEYYNAIKIWINKIQSIFGKDDFYLELQPGLSKEQIYVNKKLLELSKELNIKYIITTDSHYLKEEDSPIHSAYLNSKDGERETASFYEAAHMMTVEEVWGRMKDYLSIEQLKLAFDNTIEIKDKCEDYTLEKELKLPYTPLERKQVPIPSANNIGQFSNFIKFLKSKEPADQQLAARLYEYLKSDKVYKSVEENLKRFDYELGVIWDSSEKQNVKWSKYLLQMADYCDIIWNEGNSLICPGRGSGGASHVLNALDITQINPLREKAPLLFERFMNPYRASVLDIDIDVESVKRDKCIKALQQVYGEENVVRVSTFKTEKAKSAILAAARGLGIDVDEARYLASLVTAERGMQHSLIDMYYGNEEKLLSPNRTFIKEMDKNKELWEVAKNIEGLINGYGSHAGGVIIVDEPITNFCGIMTTTKGTHITSFDLHDAEEAGLIKIDLLATEGLSKIRTCLDLLIDYGFIERKETLRETYENAIGVYKIERDSLEMWERVWNNEIIALFQMEKQSGIQGISLTKPKSLEDLAVLNSVIRLMPSEKGAELPLDKYNRFRQDPILWDREMNRYGLNEEERKLLHTLLDYSSGICAQQEDLYQLLTRPEVGGFTLGEADVLRKAVAKKAPQDYKIFEEKFFKRVEQANLSKNLCNYVWNVLIATQRGYGFNLSHTLSYSIIGLQEMNLVHKYSPLFWNTANLIIDSGAIFSIDEEDYEDYEVDEDGMIIESDETEDAKNNKISYGKIAKAIGRMQNRGITIEPPHINESRYTFTPDIENNIIRYGLKGIVKVGEDVVESIIQKRPFSSLEDFMSKVKANKLHLVSLIKSGAFDCFGKREDIMEKYINMISETKTNLNLRNANMLITRGLLPQELDFQKRVFNYNKYLKKNNKGDIIYFDKASFGFYEENFNLDLLNVDEEGRYSITSKEWKKIYDKHMLEIKNYIKKNHDELLIKLNNDLTKDVREKYAKGNRAKWSMDSVSFYQDTHELDPMNDLKYDIIDFFSLPDEPEIDYTFTTKDGHEINMFKLYRIAGTVIDKDKNKSEVTLLTKTGVVTVKAYGIFPYYDKQISEMGSDGKKHVIEKSWFSRGSKIIVTGMKRDENTFFAKKYKKTPGHHFALIKEVLPNGNIVIQEERVEVDNND